MVTVMHAVPGQGAVRLIPRSPAGVTEVTPEAVRVESSRPLPASVGPVALDGVDAANTAANVAPAPVDARPTLRRRLPGTSTGYGGI
jgi:hypothetical protein